MDNVSSTATILVVEDEPLVLDCVADMLGQSGFAVIGAASGEEALALALRTDGICAVVSDVAMPGAIDGFELARRLRRDHPRVGVVLVSGVRQPEDGALPPGVRFISKPVRAVTLLRLVREVADPSLRLPGPVKAPL